MSDDISLQYVRKNTGDFSFLSTFADLAVNTDFKNGSNEALMNGSTTESSYIWKALSAIGNEVGGKFQEKILNFIDNVNNIDVCTIKSLESLISMMGVKYTVTDNIDKMPLDIRNLMDILSMKREYLADSLKLDPSFASYCTSNALCSETSSVSSFNEAISSEYSALSDEYPVSSDLSVSGEGYLDDTTIDSIVWKMYYDTLMSHLTRTYNDTSCTVIYKYLSASILQSGFELPHSTQSEIAKYKLKYNIPSDFDTETEMDAIEDGLSNLEDYSEYEQYILNLEADRREAAFNPLESKTKYKYYMENDVKQYFTFIQNQYCNLISAYANSNQYDVDTDYIQLGQTFDDKCLLQDSDCELKTSWISSVVDDIVSSTKTIRAIREQLKSQAQKNFMKGNFLLMKFMISEYIRNNVVPDVNSIISDDDQKVIFDADKTYAELIEYADATDYWNISSNYDTVSDDVNPRFWEDYSASVEDVGYDQFHALRKLPVVDTITPDYVNDSIKDFYYNDLKADVYNPDITKTSKKQLKDFLDTVFACGASPLSGYKEEYVECARNKLENRYDTYVSEVSSRMQAVRKFRTTNSQLSGTIEDQLTQLSTLHTQHILNSLMSYQHMISDSLSVNDYLSVYENCVSTYTAISVGLYAILSSQFENVTLNELTADTLKENISSLNSQITTAFKANKTLELYEAMKTMDEYVKIFDEMESKYLTAFQTLYYLYNARYSFDISNLSASVQCSIGEIDILADSFDDQLTYINDVYYTPWTTYNSEMVDKYETSFATDASAIVSVIDYTDIANAISVLGNDYSQLSIDWRKIVSYLNYKKDSWVSSQLSLYDFSACDNEFFDKYSGLSSADTPYYYLENQKHPSYQAHPNIGAFARYTSQDHSIQDMTGVSYEDLRDQLTADIDDFIDDNGFLSNMWRSPLMMNQSYLSRYEKTSHLDEDGKQNPIIGFDGWFYSPALAMYLNSTNASSLVSCYYSGVGISEKEKTHILEQLKKYRNLIKDIVDSKLSIKRYGLDIYQNAYILDSAGVLWIRMKNTPIAFPAYSSQTSLTSIDQFDSAYQQIDTSDVDLTNTAICQCDQVTRPGFVFPKIDDFTFSKDKSIILLQTEKCTIVNSVVKTYNNSESVKRYILKLNKVKHDDQTISYIRTDGSLSGQSSNYIEIGDDYDFIQFFSFGTSTGVIYSKVSGKDVYVAGSYYNKYADDNEYVKTIQAQKICVLPNDVEANADVKFSMYTDQSNNVFLTIASLASSSASDSYVDYLGHSIASYSSLTTYYPDTTKIFQNHAIWSKQFQLVSNMFLDTDDQDPDESSDPEGNIERCRRFRPYAENGFIPLYKGQNQLSNTMLTYPSSGFSDSELANRGILKFELNGPKGITPIDFYYCIGVRLREDYYKAEKYFTLDELTKNSKDAGISAVSLYDIRVNEPTYLSSDDDSFRCDSLKLLQQLKDQIFIARADENYINTIQKYEDQLTDYVVDQNDTLIGNNIVLVYDSDDSDGLHIPEQYVDPGYSTKTKANSDGNDFIMQITPDCNALSVSWYDTKAGIALNFNSDYYNLKVQTPMFNLPNFENIYHTFLNLDRPGTAGYLVSWQERKIGENPTGDYKIDAIYYIKNISDDKPRFLLSADVKINSGTSTNINIITNSGHPITDNNDNLFIADQSFRR